MKKLFAVILLSVVAAGAGAQTYTSGQGYAIPDNELSVYYGVASTSYMAAAISGALGTALTLGSSSFEMLVCTGVFGAEYQRYLHRSIAVGGSVSCESIVLGFTPQTGTDEYGDPVHDSGRVHRSSVTVIGVMPSVSFKWFSRSRVSMYSKLALGFMLGIGGGVYSPGVAFHLTAVGVDFGGQRLRGFMEAGAGCRGLINGGLRFCF